MNVKARNRPMDDMVEKVARAIYDRMPFASFAKGVTITPWGNIEERHRKAYSAMARAAIAAMEEPTEEMRRAGDLEPTGSYNASLYVWQAMIRAALAEEKEQA